MTDNSGEFFRRLTNGIPQALTAAGYVYANGVKRELRGGYTSGDFVTGNVMNSVTVAPPRNDGGSWSVTIGSNVDYAAFWELGHWNIFTRRYMRVPIWVPTMQSLRQDIVAAYSRTLKRAVQS